MLAWALQGANGNRNDFLFCRQSIASHIGALACIQTILARELPAIPPMLFSVDRRTVCIPGMLGWKVGVPVPPLTNSLKRFLPPAVLAGSFTTAWHVVASALAKDRGKVEVLFGAFISDPTIEELALRRIDEMTVTGEPGTGLVWPFDLLDQLIQSANNRLNADLAMIAWICTLFVNIDCVI
jgi:hypothetical protein